MTFYPKLKVTKGDFLQSKVHFSNESLRGIRLGAQRLAQRISPLEMSINMLQITRKPARRLAPRPKDLTLAKYGSKYIFRPTQTISDTFSDSGTFFPKVPKNFQKQTKKWYFQPKKSTFSQPFILNNFTNIAI